MHESFMADAAAVYKAYLRAQRAKPTYALGRLEVGLEIVSLIRTLESFPVVNEAEREGTVATLHTLLREQGLENAYEVYDQLANWRRPVFVPEHVQPTIVGAVVARAHGLRVSADAFSSAHEVRETARALADSTRAQPWERPNLEQGDGSTGGQLALPFEEG
jgi:hypothetical protein